MTRGSESGSRPPAIVRLMLRLLLPASEREFYLGDLEEAGRRRWLREVLGAVTLRFTVREGGSGRPGVDGGGAALRGIAGDLRGGLRRWRRMPAATVTALLAMSIGIGLSTLMASLIHGTLLPTLPYPAGDRIVRVNRTEYAPLTAASLVYWRERQGSFEGLASWVERLVNLGIENGPTEPAQGASIEVTAFPLLSVRPVHGRLFDEADGRAGASAVALIGYATWRTRFGGDPGVLGRTVRLNGEPAVIIGVMPEGFGFPRRQELWTPLRLDAFRPGGPSGVEIFGSLQVFGVLRDGVSMAAALAELNALDAQRPRPIGEVEPERIEVGGFTDIINPAGRSQLLGGVMLGVALLVLLVACANAMNVLLAQAVVRGREVAVRAALGASRARIATQFWLEVSMLALAGAAGGVLLAGAGLRVIRSAVPQSDIMPYWFTFRIDLPVLGFVVVATAAAAMLAGLAPGLHAARANGHELLKEASRGASSRRLGRTMSRLIAAEMAVSFVLLVAAGLSIRSVVNLSRTPLPFDPAGVLTSRVQLPDDRYAGAADRVAFIERLERSLDAMGEVTASAITTGLPGVVAVRRPVAIDGVHLPADTDLPETRYIAATSRFFEMFDAAPLAGRTFLSTDRADAQPVVVVNRAFARAHLGEDAVGRRIALPARDGSAEWLTIVGVVPDLLAGGIERQLEEAVYRPLVQAVPLSVLVTVRSPLGASVLTQRIRDAVSEADPDAALFMMMTLDDSINGATAGIAWMSALFLIAGALALFLAAIGLYGVMAFWVAQRTREIGVRMALGGGRRAIVGIVLHHGMKPIAFGLLAGLLIAAPIAWLLRAVLLHVRPLDPLVFGIVPAVLLATGWLGCALPAHRATRVDPQTALASE